MLKCFLFYLSKILRRTTIVSALWKRSLVHKQVIQGHPASQGQNWREAQLCLYIWVLALSTLLDTDTRWPKWKHRNCFLRDLLHLHSLFLPNSTASLLWPPLQPSFQQMHSCPCFVLHDITITSYFLLLIFDPSLKNLKGSVLFFFFWMFSALSLHFSKKHWPTLCSSLQRKVWESCLPHCFKFHFQPLCLLLKYGLAPKR